MPNYTVISLGAGVQSSTMLLMALEGAFDKVPDYAVFADTGAEPKVVYDYLDWLESVVDGRIPIIRASRGSLTDDLYSYMAGERRRVANPPFFVQNEADGKRKSGILRRYCTKEYKIEVVVKAIREQVLGLKPRQRVPKDVRVEQWMGISTDEAIRMKPSQYPWITNRWVLIEKNMSRDDCLQWMADHNYPLPPKSSCVFCPYHSDAMWQDLKTNHPEDWKTVVELDRAIRNGMPKVNGQVYLHRSMKPIDEIEFKVNDEDRDELFGNECEGMCGL